MEPAKAKAAVESCAQSRAQVLETPPEMTIAHAIENARWLESMHDGFLSSESAKATIKALHAALQASPCYYKGAREGIPTFTFLAYDRAGHVGIRYWAELAAHHGARPEKFESALALVTEWEKRDDLRWPT